MTILFKFFVFLFFIGVGFFSRSQAFLNGSFENTTSGAFCNYNLSNAVFNGLISNVNAYGSGNEMDIIISGCYSGALPNGTYAVALAATYDEIAMQLSAPLVAGNSYSISFWSYGEVSFRPLGGLEIGLSLTNNAFGTSIGATNSVANTWTNHVICFVAPNNGSFITLRNTQNGITHWNHVDNFVFVSPDASFDFNDFCLGAANGPSNIATPGGTFSFNPLPGDGATINPTTGEISNEVDGASYSVQYATSGACANSSVEVVSVNGFNYSATIVDETCGDANGEINLTPNGGAGPYQYSLNAGPTQPTGSFTGLVSGNYAVLITDNNGCTATGSETVNNTGGPTIVSITPTNLSCSGTCDGEIAVVVSGGNPPYSYQWFDGAGVPIGTDSPTITGLCADNYSVEVTDASGGSTQLNNNSDFDVPGAAPCDCPFDFNCNNDAGQVYDGISSVYAVGDMGCVTGSTGYSNSLGAHSGNGYVYFYAGADFISDGPFTFVGGENVELCVYYAGPQGSGPPGQNTANSHFSFGMDGVQIGPDVPVPTNTGWTEFCFSVVMTPGNHTFQILSGGAAQYSMWFDDFSITSITGGGGTACSSTANTSVTGSIASDATFSFTDFCEGTPNSAFDIVTAGGTFAFNPLPGDGATINSVTGEISNEVAGTTYSVEYSIGGACPDTHVEQVVVNANPTPIITGDLTYCPGGNVTLDAGAGYAAYNWTVGGVFWGAGGTAQTVTTTALNDIAVSVSTIAGCIGISPAVDVVESATIITNTNLTICEWGSVVIHGNLESTANTYTFTTTSVGGCDSTSNVTLTVNPLPEISNLTIVNESCQGENDGSIEIVSLNNQVGAITYSWDILPDPGNVTAVNDLPSGVYTVTIFDAGTACVSDSAITILAGPICCDIALTATSIVNPTCDNDNGLIVVGSTGGDGTYTYSLNGGLFDPSNTFSNLSAGIYEIVVQDGSGNCSDTIQVNLTNPGAPTIISLIGYNLNCNDDNSGAITVTANGGQGAISYEIILGSATITSATGQFSGLQAGNYTVVATDANGCGVTDNIAIVEPDEMILQILSTDIPCNDLTAGSITINVTNGVAPFQYSIDNGATWVASNSFLALSVQNYSIIVQDDNGCLVNGAASISEEVQPTADFIYNPLKLTVFDSDIFTYNYSANATDYYWEITGPLGYSFSYSTTEIEHVFPQDTGTYVICLTATNPTGCSDVLCKTIVVQEDIVVYVPNAFTPDGNEFNQYFYPVVRGVDSQDYDFLIYDRWGELIFESNNVSIGWDGTYKGKIAQSGTYTWKIITKDPDIDNRRVFLGHVNLLR